MADSLNGSIPSWTEDTPEANAEWERETREVEEPDGEVIPPKTGVEDAEDDFPLESLITTKVVGTTLSLPGLIMAKRTGHEFWRLDDEEINLLGEAWQPLTVYLVRKYLGEGVGMFAAAAATGAAIYGPRVMREMKSKKDEAGKGRKRPNQPTHPDSSPTPSPSSSDSGEAENPSNSDGYNVTFKE